MNANAIPERVIHRQVAKAIKKTGTANTQEWKKQELQVEGRKAHLLGQLARNRFRNRNPYFGYGTWENYVEQHHGVTSIGKDMKFTDETLHRMMYTAIKRIGSTKIKDWKNSKIKIGGRTPMTLYSLARNRTVEKPGWSRSLLETFFGHGLLNNYAKWLERNYTIENGFVKRIDE